MTKGKSLHRRQMGEIYKRQHDSSVWNVDSWSTRVAASEKVLANNRYQCEGMSVMTIGTLSSFMGFLLGIWFSCGVLGNRLSRVDYSRDDNNNFIWEEKRMSDDILRIRNREAKENVMFFSLMLPSAKQQWIAIWRYTICREAKWNFIFSLAWSAANRTACLLCD